MTKLLGLVATEIVYQRFSHKQKFRREVEEMATTREQLIETVEEMLQPNVEGNIDNETLQALFKMFLQYSVDSSFEVWKEANPTGTKANFIAFLVGPQGIQGIQGISAYQVALVNGYTGTQAEWLLSLKSIRATALGPYDVTTNTPALTAVPSGALVDGDYYDLVSAGTIGFAGANFASGANVKSGDQLKKVGALWYLVPAYNRFTRDYIKLSAPVLSTIEENIIRAIKVLDLTVPSSQKDNDWRITFVTTVPTTTSLQASFKYRLQIRNLDTNTNFALVNENATFDASSLNGDKYYAGSVTVGADTVVFNVSIDWNFLLGLGANFEYNNTTTSYLKLKTGIYTQRAEIIKLVDAGDAALKTEIDNGRYDFLADKTKNFSTTEKHILRAIKLLDITVPSAEKGDDWRVTFVTTTPVSAGLVANFKYRFQIRNITKGKDYALINENATFDANTLNGFKSYSGTSTNGTTTIEFNIQFDWSYLLSVGGTFEFSDYGSNLVLRKGVFSQSTDNAKRLSVVEASNTLLAGTKVPAIETILSDFNTSRLYTINDGFYVANTAVGLVPAIVPNATRRYVKLPVKASDIFYVTSTVNGSALALATFVDASNVVLSVVEPGVDNTDHVHVNYALTPPTNAVFCYIDGSTLVDIVIDRMKPNYWFGIDGIYYYSTYRRSAKYPISPTDKIKITTTVNGAGVWSVVYLNAAGNVINGASQGKGENGEDKTWTDLLLVPPATATHFILNSNTATPYYLYTPQPIVQAASKVYVDAIFAAINATIATVNAAINAVRLLFKVLTGKTGVTYGTSLVDSSLWPVDAFTILGGTGINKGVGSSTARISRADGSYNGLAWQNYCYALMHTIEEKQYIIDNWDWIKVGLTNNPPTVLSSAEQAKILGCSYQNRVLPYLNGTLPMPDIFLLEHGRNDGYSNDLTVFPADRTDRRYYLGAMCFLIDLIYEYNPYARIAIIGYYEDDDLVNVSVAQLALAKLFKLPILKTWELSGFSQQKVKGSYVKWGQAPWNAYVPVGQDTSQDMTVRRVQIPDNIHFSSDLTGKAQDKMTKLVTNFLKTLF